MNLARRLHDEALDDGDLEKLRAAVAKVGHRRVAELIDIGMHSLMRALANAAVSRPTRSAIHHWLETRATGRHQEPVKSTAR